MLSMVLTLSTPSGRNSIQIYQSISIIDSDFPDVSVETNICYAHEPMNLAMAYGCYTFESAPNAGIKCYKSSTINYYYIYKYIQ